MSDVRAFQVIRQRALAAYDNGDYACASGLYEQARDMLPDAHRARGALDAVIRRLRTRIDDQQDTP
jgi:hypothetical protein